MTTKMTISNEQQKTADLFQGYLDAKWSSNAQAIANLFNAHHTAAYDLDSITGACHHLYGTAMEADFTGTLKALVRAGVLRSRLSNGTKRRLWEVNY